jgi:hypothetical protein
MTIRVPTGTATKTDPLPADMSQFRILVSYIWFGAANQPGTVNEAQTPEEPLVG